MQTARKSLNHGKQEYHILISIIFCPKTPNLPPPPSCGCGGRKKRSLPEKPTFVGIAASGDDVMCNTPALKKIIMENIQTTAVDSSKAINTVLESRQLQSFVVVCSEKPFVFTFRADTAYCGATKNGHNCHASAM